MTLFGFRYPAVILLAGVVAGTVIGRLADPGISAPAVAVLAAGLLLVYGFYRLPRRYYFIPLALFVFLGAQLNSYLAFQLHPTDDVGQYAPAGKPIRYFARIVEWPTLKRHRTILTCGIDSIVDTGVTYRASGAIHLLVPQETTRFTLGDQISFTGILRRPQSHGFPGRFDYARYLYNQGIRGTVFLGDQYQILVHASRENSFGVVIGDLRQWILNCFRSRLREVPASLASGFLIGETRHIPDDIYQAFRRTGTMHLLAVSGSNVALVLLAVAFLFRFIRMKPVLRSAALLAVIVIFSHLSYNQPSVIRASVMAALILIARLIYRRIDLNNIIAVAAALLIFLDPGNLYDVGFQLSFAVTWGLILFLPHFNRLFAGMKMPGLITYPLLVACSSVIATVISAPITGYYFGEISLVTVASNLLVVPMVSLAVVGSLILLLTNLIIPAVAMIPGMALDRLLGAIHAVVAWFGRWEFAEVHIGSFSAVYAFLMLGGAILVFSAISYRFMRLLLVVFLLGVGGFVLAARVMSADETTPRVEIFNLETCRTIIIAQGEGALVYQQLENPGYDAFTHDLLPYVKEHYPSLPRYFIFVEPAYRTEFHLAEISEEFPNLRIRSLRTVSGETVVSIRPTADTDDDLAGGSSLVVETGPGWVAVQFQDSGGVIFAENLRTLDSISLESRKGMDYIIVGLDEKSDIARLGKAFNLSNLIFLVAEPVDTEAVDAGPSGQGGAEEGRPAIIGRPDQITVPLRAGRYAP